MPGEVPRGRYRHAACFDGSSALIVSGGTTYPDPAEALRAEQDPGTASGRPLCEVCIISHWPRPSPLSTCCRAFSLAPFRPRHRRVCSAVGKPHRAGSPSIKPPSAAMPLAHASVAEWRHILELTQLVRALLYASRPPSPLPAAAVEPLGDVADWAAAPSGPLRDQAGRQASPPRWLVREDAPNPHPMGMGSPPRDDPTPRILFAERKASIRTHALLA